MTVVVEIARAICRKQFRPVASASVAIISNIIDAVRKFGRSTQRTALRRLDHGLEGRQVLGIEQRTVRDSSGTTSMFVGTTAPVPEKVEILSPEQVAPIVETAQYGLNFLRAYG